MEAMTRANRHNRFQEIAAQAGKMRPMRSCGALAAPGGSSACGEARRSKKSGIFLSHGLPYLREIGHMAPVQVFRVAEINIGLRELLWILQDPCKEKHKQNGKPKQKQKREVHCGRASSFQSRRSFSLSSRKRSLTSGESRR